MSLPPGGGVPLSFAKENTVSQLIEVMSDVDLLGMMVGSKTAARMLQDAGGRLSTLLNVCPTSYQPEDHGAVHRGFPTHRHRQDPALRRSRPFMSGSLRL